jgi:hypothetical protein
MLASTPDYGPFAPVVGYAGAIMATGAAIFTLWGGKSKTWRPPDKDLPGTAQKFVLLLCGVFMVVEWYFAGPTDATWMIVGFVTAAVLAFVFYLMYSSLIGSYGYKKPVLKDDNRYEETLVLGGRDLRPEAEEKRRQLGIDTQALLEGAAFNVDLLWDRPSLQWVRTRALVYFVMMLVLGTSALTTASFSVQVILTKRAASSVIHREEAPGLAKEPNAQ